jgi:hypothetical protein
MDKLKFEAIYGGSCYIKAYGRRKFYKHGVLLSDIICNGNLIADKISVPKGKAFDCLDVVADIGKRISFDAVLNSDKTINYISNIHLT